MRPIDADALTEFLKCLLPENGMWEIEGDTEKNAVCETVAEAIEMVKNMETIQPEKAQLSQEGTTSDLIDRQQALDIFDDYNVSVENGELEAYSRDRKRLLELPTIQPVATDTNVGDKISRQAALDALDKRFDNIPMEQTAEILMLRKDLRELPTVQPEQPIIKCKDCKWWKKQKDSAQGRCGLLGIYPTGAWYCANGATERRTE